MHPLLAFAKKLIIPTLFILPISIIISPLFFYNLGATSLIDFDEAWYAEIARNILVTHNPFMLFFNGKEYIDHPPLGFILIAVSFLIFGINEFASRFPSTLLGLGSVILIYKIGQNLFNKTIGLGASLVLISSVWFILRARSGNLDTIFLFFFLLTIYCATKIKNNTNWILFFAASFAGLLQIKSLIGLSALIPAMAIIFIHQKSSLGKPKQSFKLQTLSKKIVLGLVIFILILSPWVFASYKTYGNRFLHQLIRVGLRPENRVKPNFRELSSSLTFTYLHFGIREWYYPFLIAFVISPIFAYKKPLIISVYLWIISLMAGFLTNSKTEIWHLIPIYPAVGLLIAFFAYHSIYYPLTFAEKFIKNFSKLASPIFVILFLLFAAKQIYEYRNDVKLFEVGQSGLAYTAVQAKYYQEKLFLDADYFFPVAVFYSQKKVFLVKGGLSPKSDLKGIIEYEEKPFLLLTEQWRLDLDKIDTNRYQGLASHDGHVLIKVIN